MQLYHFYYFFVVEKWLDVLFNKRGNATVARRIVLFVFVILSSHYPEGGHAEKKEWKEKKYFWTYMPTVLKVEASNSDEKEEWG